MNYQCDEEEGRTETCVSRATVPPQASGNDVPSDYWTKRDQFFAPFIDHGEHSHRLQLRNDSGELIDAPAYDREFAEQKYAALLSEFCMKDDDDSPNPEYSCITIVLKPVN